MKLSEVIKAIEDGSKSSYEKKLNKGVYKLQIWGAVIHCLLDDCYTESFPLDGWEEVKPPRQWSEKELMLFKLLPDWANWISAEKDERVYFWEFEPIKIKEHNIFSVNDNGGSLRFLGGIFDFLTITFEESPIYIGDLKNV